MDKGRTISYSSRDKNMVNKTKGTRLDLRYPPHSGGSRPRGAAPRPGPKPRPGVKFAEPPSRGYYDEYDEDYGGRRRKPSEVSGKKSRFGALFAIVIFSGIVVCVSAFALVVGSLTQGLSASGTNPAPTPRQGGTLGIFGVPREIRQTTLIMSTDAANQTFLLYGIMDGQMFYASVTSGTEMRDRYGNNLVFGQFRAGDVVEIVYPEGDLVLTSIRQSPNAQTFTNQQGLIVEPIIGDTGRITLGSSTYIFGRELVSMFRGQPHDIERVSPMDRVTLRVYRHVAVFVEVTTGHGIIDLVFNDNIRGGTIAIGSEVFGRLDQNRQFSLSEGTHRLIITGDNIETYQREIAVRNGETVLVDLEDVQFRTGVVYFTSNVDNIFLTINDTPWDLGTPRDLLYGSYNIRATAMGYQIYERRIEVRQPMVNHNIVMQPLPTPPPRPDRVETRRITITTPNTGGVEVYIDGRFVGRTSEGFHVQVPTLAFDLELGSWELRLSREGYQDWIQMLTILPEDRDFLDFTFILHPVPGFTPPDRILLP